jgi:hypothetical protein
MTSRRRFLALAAGVALALPTVQAQASTAGYSRAAAAVLARARAASGGAAWNMLRGWQETGLENGRRYEAWFDPLRYGMRVETHGPDGLTIHGFNGVGDWRILPDGRITGAADHLDLARARTEAFFRSESYFYPGRFDAEARYVGVRRLGSRNFEVLVVRPWGGNPRELWFDVRTHLLTRIVDRTGRRPVVEELSDYRKVGPVRIAFRIAVKGGDERRIETVVFTPADRDLFSLPRPVASR